MHASRRGRAGHIWWSDGTPMVNGNPYLETSHRQVADAAIKLLKALLQQQTITGELGLDLVLMHAMMGDHCASLPHQTGMILLMSQDETQTQGRSPGKSARSTGHTQNCSTAVQNLRSSARARIRTPRLWRCVGVHICSVVRASHAIHAHQHAKARMPHHCDGCSCNNRGAGHREQHHLSQAGVHL